MLENTVHSNEGVIARLGLNPNETLEMLKSAKEVTYKEATRVASIFHNHKGNRYYLAPDMKRPGEQVILIVRGNRVVTVLTKMTNSFYGVEAEMRDGRCVIRTMDGGVIEDGYNWVRKRRNERRSNEKRRKTY